MNEEMNSEEIVFSDLSNFFLHTVLVASGFPTHFVEVWVLGDRLITEIDKGTNATIREINLLFVHLYPHT